MVVQPYSYYGGKQKLAKRIVDLIPDHSIYVEPFFGGGSVFFEKGRKPASNNCHYREVINDSNLLVYNFLKVCQNEDLFFKLNKMIKHSLYHQEEYRKCNEYIKNYNVKNKYLDLELAYSFYYSINASYANKINGGFAYSKSSQNHAFSFLNRKTNIDGLSKRLSECYIFHEDAVKLMSRFDSEKSLFYIDPPYVNTEQGHYSGYGLSDLKILIEFLNNIKGKYILSGYSLHGEPLNYKRCIDIKTITSIQNDESKNKERI